MDEGQLIDVLAELRQHVGDHLARLAARGEFPRAAHDRPIFSLKRNQILLAGKRLAVVFLESRLMLEQVNM